MASIRERTSPPISGRYVGHPSSQCVAESDRRALLQAGDALAEAVEWQHAEHRGKPTGRGCVGCAAHARWRKVVG